MVILHYDIDIIAGLLFQGVQSLLIVWIVAFVHKVCALFVY